MEKEVDNHRCITRIMARLNLILKIKDTDINETYYIFYKSSKIWSDINFFSARITTIDDIQIPIEETDGIYNSGDIEQTQIKEHISRFEKDLSEEYCKNLASTEFGKIFGTTVTKGNLLKDTIGFIEESKTVGEITYYHNFFYVITEMPDLSRIIGLKTIELIPKNLIEKLASRSEVMHDRYEPSHILQLFIKNRLWAKDDYPPLEPKHLQAQKRIGVLFSDLKGFGQLVNQFASSDEAESTRLLIKKYQHLASAHIKLHGGYVVQTAGDAFMAIFSLSENIENDLFRMLQAAIGILAISEIKIHENSEPIKIRTRIGMNVAEVEEGFTGALDLREYTVFGKDVNVASRLEEKVDDVADSISDFRGGLLLNLNTSIEYLNSTENNKLDLICNDIVEYSKALPNTVFKKRLEKLSEDMKDYYVLDNLLDTLTHKVKLYLNREHLGSFVIQDSICSMQVKEGAADCLFIYRAES